MKNYFELQFRRTVERGVKRKDNIHEQIYYRVDFISSRSQRPCDPCDTRLKTMNDMTQRFSGKQETPLCFDSLCG